MPIIVRVDSVPPDKTLQNLSYEPRLRRGLGDVPARPYQRAFQEAPLECVDDLLFGLLEGLARIRRRRLPTQ